ncbi:signal peptidase II [candidate division WWE3 bacterium]|nr:signal peptidase II [candidate division WWE3 bacterium]
MLIANNPVVNCTYLLTQRIFLAGGVLIVLFLFLLFLEDISKSLYLSIGMGVLAGGAISNIVERTQTGCVTDHFTFLNLVYFNTADIAIAAGILVLAHHLLRKSL